VNVAHGVIDRNKGDGASARLDHVGLEKVVDLLGGGAHDRDFLDLHASVEVVGLSLKQVGDLNSDQVLLAGEGQDAHLLAVDFLSSVVHGAGNGERSGGRRGQNRSGDRNGRRGGDQGGHSGCGERRLIKQGGRRGSGRRSRGRDREESRAVCLKDWSGVVWKNWERKNGRVVMYSDHCGFFCLRLCVYVVQRMKMKMKNRKDYKKVLSSKEKKVLQKECTLEKKNKN
jgi:hypothetical protein